MTLFLAQEHYPDGRFIKLKVQLKQSEFYADTPYKNYIKTEYNKAPIEEILGFEIQECFFLFSKNCVDFFILIDGLFQKIEVDFNKAERKMILKKYPFVDKI